MRLQRVMKNRAYTANSYNQSLQPFPTARSPCQVGDSKPIRTTPSMVRQSLLLFHLLELLANPPQLVKHQDQSLMPKPEHITQLRSPCTKARVESSASAHEHSPRPKR
eukprot:906475-Amphidinium_carterae.1